MSPVVHSLFALLVALAGVWPLHPRPEVTAGFSPPSTRWSAGHRGVDLLGRPGQSVVAAAAGTVTFAGRLAGRGVVVVNHGRTRTTYEPVTASVAVGAAVSAGEPVGTLQAFGSHCWPRTCLHWGLLEGTSYLDPLSLVGGWRVRLLPLAGPPPWPVTSAGPPALVPPALARPTLVPPAVEVWPPREATPGGAPVGRPGAAARW